MAGWLLRRVVVAVASNGNADDLLGCNHIGILLVDVCVTAWQQQPTKQLATILLVMAVAVLRVLGSSGGHGPLGQTQIQETQQLQI